ATPAALKTRSGIRMRRIRMRIVSGRSPRPRRFSTRHGTRTEMSAQDANVYEISRLLYDLRNPANREAFRADSQAYYQRYAIGDRGMRLLMDRDWQGLVDAGVTVYLLTKLGAALGV